MNIIIDDFSIISYRERLDVISQYCYKFEYVKKEKDIFNLTKDVHYLKETGKNPVIISIPFRNYHVLCTKNKKSYSFKIWLAV